MLTVNQKKYLATLPLDKVAKVKPFDKKAKITAEKIIAEIKAKIPELIVLFMGSTALEIAGQNDIDLHILSRPEEFSDYVPTLEKIFGKSNKTSPTLVKWELVRNGFDVELYLTDKNSAGLKEQEKTFELLQKNPDLKKEYEYIKTASNNLPFVEYMTKKYEFFNRILGL